MWVCYKWEELNINWESVHMNWEEVGFIIGEVIPLSAPVIGEKHDLKKLNELPEKKKRKIIKIVCKITGEPEYISYKYKNEDIVITAEHIDIILEELIKNKIIVNVQNIS
jgi:hypothetical protein